MDRARDEFDKEVQALEERDAWNEKDEVVEVEVRRPLDKIVPVRLSAEDWRELRRLANKIGVGPSVLVRMWVLEHLRSAGFAASA